MKRFYAHPTEEDVYINDSNYSYAGTNDNNVKIYFSNKIEDKLSPRELEVYKLKSFSVDEISNKLSISQLTVKKYLNKINNIK